MIQLRPLLKVLRGFWESWLLNKPIKILFLLKISYNLIFLLVYKLLTVVLGGKAQEGTYSAKNAQTALLKILAFSGTPLMQELLTLGIYICSSLCSHLTAYIPAQYHMYINTSSSLLP